MKTQPQPTLQHWLLAARPKTLPAALAPIALSLALVWHQANTLAMGLALATIFCALSLQIAANFANDYFDARKGIDTANRLGPARAVQQGWISERAMLAAVGFTLLLSTVSGLYLISQSSVVGGGILLFVGLLCIAATLAYSAGPKPLASHALGEVAVFIFFGPVAVIGCFHLQAANINGLTLQPWLLLPACQMGLLSAAIMLVNNLRDHHTDQAANKQTLVVKLGLNRGKQLYLAVLTAASLCQFALLSSLNTAPIYSYLTLAVSLLLMIQLYRRTGAALNQQLAQTAALMALSALSATLDLMF